MTEQPSKPENQREVIEFLSRAQSYGLGEGRIERVETHCSIVFLAEDRAFKLKRAIRYADLDYTTREARRKACEAEILLNRRTAPDLYLEARSINRAADGGLAFDGPGAAVDHVVVMRRFSEENLLNHLADRFALTPELMVVLGQAVARLHRMADVTPEHGGAEAIRRVVAGNARELAKVAPALDGAPVAAAGSRALDALERLGPLLERRRAGGKVRRCHGDLRLANIVFDRGEPALFDCIEFNDEIGCIDILYDLAFLLMDLILRNRSDLANAVFNAYLERQPETEGLSALPLFLALRAATRSYGLAGRARREGSARQAARLLVSARRHLDAAIVFLEPMPPRLIAIGGACGQPKAWLTDAMAGFVPPAPGARVVHVGADDEVAWREARLALGAGCSVLAEGAFLSAAERNRAAAISEDLGAAFVGLWYGAPAFAPAGRDWRALDAGEGALSGLAGIVEGAPAGWCRPTAAAVV